MDVVSQRITLSKILTIAFALVIVSVTPRAQTPTFSSTVAIVRVDVLVTNNGQPLAGLTAKDFEIRDNGVLQRVALVGLETLPVNVVLTLDTSDSVVGERLERLRRSANTMLSGLAPRDQSALITFSHVVRLNTRLSADPAAAQTALTHVTAGGGTALVDGVYAGLQVGQSDAGRELLVIFSDGLDTASWLTPRTVLDVAKRSTVVAYAVSVRSRARPAFLQELTLLTGGRLFEVERSDDLESTFTGILQEFRKRYVIGYTPAGVIKTGWHQLDVKVKRGGTVRARPGYQW